MSKKTTWEEALEEYRSIKKMEFEKMNEEINNKKFSQNPNYKFEYNNKEKNKYYHIENLELDPQKISKRISEREKAIDLEQRRRSYHEEKGDPKGKIVNIPYTLGHPTAEWKSWDDKKVKEEILKRTLNGENVKMAIETLKNFDVDEIDAKMGVIQDFSNDPKILQKYTELYKNKGHFNPTDENIEELEKFFSKYEILEEPKLDKKSGMSALVIGNKETKEVEIIFGGSQGPSNILSKGSKGKRARQDWGKNNAVSPVITPATQKAAKDFTNEVKERYKNGHNGYRKLTTINGHSKAGGEAIYSTSFIPGLKCFAIDPAPITDCGPWINQNNLLTIVPNMGNGFIASAERIEGTEFHVLKIKPTIKNDKTFKTLAVPVECIDNDEHFPDNEMAVDRLRELQKYAVQVEKKIQERQKDEKTVINV
ncbi:MAG: hypothetical protein Q4D53_08420, partial [Leptotrichiaceae bacterium]|nr:hypothetical protein [Leptotrichiaceae bacterium]